MTDQPLLTVYEKPTCSTCRNLRDLLLEEGIPFERVNYMIEPLLEPILRDLLRKSGLRPRDVLRAKEARDAGITPEDGRSDNDIVKMIVEEPALLQRPIVEMGERAVLARPIEKVRELFPEMSSAPPKIGLIGCGTIGARIGATAHAEGFGEVAFVHARDGARAAELFPNARWIADPEEIAEQEVDLVIEAATSEVMRGVLLDVLARRDLLAFTLTGLADDALRERASETCRSARTRLYIPHGGILGLDGISDGRSELEAVTITTTKSPKSLGLPDAAREGVVYDGPTRGACHVFPRNVNVHAALALCGLGFDRTRSVVIADPKTGKNGHVIEVKGKGLEWRLEIESPAGKGVTGAYTPVSGVSTARRILSNTYDIVLA